MSNNLNSNPLIVDTKMDNSLVNFAGPKYLPVAISRVSNPLGVVSSRFRVKKVVWKNSQANGDTFSISDGAPTNASVIASGIAVTLDVGIPQMISVDREVADLWVTQITSGTLLIYLDEVD